MALIESTKAPIEPTTMAPIKTTEALIEQTVPIEPMIMASIRPLKASIELATTSTKPTMALLSSMSLLRPQVVMSSGGLLLQYSPS